MSTTGGGPKSRASASKPADAKSPGTKGTKSGVRRTRTPRRSAGELSGASGLAYQATDSVLRAASDGASGISRQVTDILDRQVGHGAAMIGQVASSTRLAADDMSESMPQLGGMVRSVAERIDAYADSMRDKTVDQIMGTAADFTRRQPVAVFGLAALAGFFVLRAIGNAPAPPAKAKQAGGRSRSNG